METQLILACRLNFMADEAQTDLLRRTDEVSRLISGLIRSLEAKQ